MATHSLHHPRCIDVHTIQLDRNFRFKFHSHFLRFPIPSRFCALYNMNLCFLVYALLLLFLSSSIDIADQPQSSQITKSGCSETCGGVKIPFPFGIENGCYVNNYTTYRIKCDTTNPNSVPLLDTFRYREVLSINIADHSIRVSSGVAYQCYRNDTPISSTDNSSYHLDDMFRYNMSATRNKFVAIGCDTTARVWDGESTGLDMTGCMTSCLSLQTVSDESCSGRGCCETAIFNSMSEPRIEVSSFYNHTRVDNFNPCSMAFVGEVGSYNFSVANLTVSASDCDKIRVPMVYDWYIHSSYNSCSVAKNSTIESPVCGSNTQCSDGVDSLGGVYRCQCKAGYAGNPYLSQGCQDINECQDESLNNCLRNEYCVNKKGGYDCRCPNGSQGTGTMTSPCIIDPESVVVNSKVVVALSLGLGLILSLIILYGLYKLLKRRKEIREREHNFKRNGGLLLQQEMSATEGSIERAKIFSRKELEKATNGFNENRILGRGGQGTVYKGMLVDGTIVAVKKSMKVDENQLAQFINEVVILTQTNHRNIVKIFGCCLETEVPMLVYEFVPNGTLYHHIHHPSEDFQITWKMRFQIAIECAGAVAYLHSSSSSPIFHRDIKSSNILLDEKYRAKVADFGTSKTVSIDQTHVTTCVQGTFGYLDPEFFQSSQFTDKSDVYSFGVVLLELITSKKPISADTSRENRGLATEFLQLMENSPEKLCDILDNQVLQECSKEEIQELANLTKQCLNLNGKQRPTMKEVAMTLEMIRLQYGNVEDGKSLIQGKVTKKGEDLWSDQISMEKYEGTFSTSTTTENHYSMEVQPFLIDSS